MKFTKYLLTTVFLAVSISCSTAANTNQTNAVSQNTADSGTVVNTSSNETSTAQTSAPDEVVKELYKQDKAKKNPLYETKDRTIIEKYFTKDFVDVIWKGGKDPNQMVNGTGVDGEVITGFGIDGDILYNNGGGLEYKSEKMVFNKPKINGDKAEVVVSLERDVKAESVDAHYFLTKQKDGWRISDFGFSKPNNSESSSMTDLIKSRKKASQEFGKELNEEFRNVKTPFVGKRWFVTDKGGSGTGTPQYYLRITEEHYAFCGFMQTNQADGEVTEEEIPLGKFRNTFDCNFKNDLGGKHSYQVKENYIYELDKNKKVIEDSKSEFYEDNYIKGQN